MSSSFAVVFTSQKSPPLQNPATRLAETDKLQRKLNGSLPANPVNDRRKANAVTLKRTFCLP